MAAKTTDTADEKTKRLWEIRCPLCNAFVSRAEEGSGFEVNCRNNRCRAKLVIKVNGKLEITVLDPGKKSNGR